jgi:TRAP-type C4-dicarboxylate transport system permease small subunit
MNALNKFWNRVNGVVEAILYLLVIALVVVVAAQVFWRYFLENSLTWSEELARFMFIWVIFLGAEVTLRKKAHIAIDSLVNSLKGIPQLILSLLIDLIIIIFAVIVLYSGIELVQATLNQYSSALHISIGLVYSAIPVSMALMIVNLVISIIGKIKNQSISTDIQTNDISID